MASTRTCRDTGGLVDLAAGQISREIFVNDAIYREELEREHNLRNFSRRWAQVMDADGWEDLAAWRRGA